jgi:hypothetical protein
MDPLWNKAYNDTMVEIKVKAQVDATVGQVWDVISKVDDDSKFWNLTKVIRNISKGVNEIERDVRLGKYDKCRQKITLVPNEAVHIHWTKGLVKGTKDIILTMQGNTTLLEVEIDYVIHGPAALFPGRITEQLQVEAELAVDLIKEKAEGRPHIIPMQERRSWADLIRG